MTGEFAVAVHSLVFLNHMKETVSSEVLAKNVCTNPARVRKVLAKLKKRNLVLTKEGIDGGYYFDQDPNRVNLADICEALEIKAVDSSYRSGDPDVECMIASGMAGVMDDIYQTLNQNCMESLKKITIAIIDEELQKRKKQKASG